MDPVTEELVQRSSSVIDVLNAIANPMVISSDEAAAFSSPSQQASQYLAAHEESCAIMNAITSALTTQGGQVCRLLQDELTRVAPPAALPQPKKAAAIDVGGEEGKLEYLLSIEGELLGTLHHLSDALARCSTRMKVLRQARGERRIDGSRGSSATPQGSPSRTSAGSSLKPPEVQRGRRRSRLSRLAAFVDPTSSAEEVVETEMPSVEWWPNPWQRMVSSVCDEYDDHVDDDDDISEIVSASRDTTRRLTRQHAEELSQIRYSAKSSNRAVSTLPSESNVAESDVSLVLQMGLTAGLSPDCMTVGDMSSNSFLRHGKGRKSDHGDKSRSARKPPAQWFIIRKPTRLGVAVMVWLRRVTTVGSIHPLRRVIDRFLALNESHMVRLSQHGALSLAPDPEWCRLWPKEMDAPWGVLHHNREGDLIRLLHNDASLFAAAFGQALVSWLLRRGIPVCTSDMSLSELRRHQAEREAMGVVCNVVPSGEADGGCIVLLVDISALIHEAVLELVLSRVELGAMSCIARAAKESLSWLPMPRKDPNAKNFGQVTSTADGAVMVEKLSMHCCTDTSIVIPTLSDAQHIMLVGIAQQVRQFVLSLFQEPMNEPSERSLPSPQSCATLSTSAMNSMCRDDASAVWALVEALLGQLVSAYTALEYTLAVPFHEPPGADTVFPALVVVLCMDTSVVLLLSGLMRWLDGGSLSASRLAALQSKGFHGYVVASVRAAVEAGLNGMLALA